jgi:hypothetical protein
MTEETKQEEIQDEKQNPVEEAKEILNQIKEQNRILAENLQKQEELKAHNLISGNSVAGKPSESKEQKEIESARNLILGTGFEDKIFPRKK